VTHPRRGAECQNLDLLRHDLNGLAQLTSLLAFLAAQQCHLGFEFFDTGLGRPCDRCAPPIAKGSTELFQDGLCTIGRRPAYTGLASKVRDGEPAVGVLRSGDGERMRSGPKYLLK
jgi:hypothetical protein